MTRRQLDRQDLAVDRLSEVDASVQVVLLDRASFGTATERGPRRPHRHDYHELIWVRAGAGRQLIDGDAAVVEPGTLTVIGRGQVHLFERASRVDGAVVRFRDELLYGDGTARAQPTWLLGSQGPRTVVVPAGDAPRLQSVIEILAAETRRPADSCSLDLQRHLLSALLLWVERWYDAPRTQKRGADDSEVQLYRRFVDVLERDFARRHDTGHYSAELRVPQSLLARALTHVTGRGTKELISERRMLEAARLLRFTDLTIGEIAFRSGFGDQMYFSRAFKQHNGVAPTVYRERARGPSHRFRDRAEGSSP